MDRLGDRCSRYPGMESVLLTIIQSHDSTDFALVQLVLLALQHGAPLPDIAAPLLGLAYDENCILNHSWMALEAFIHNCTDDGVVTRSLQRLLRDVADGILTDVGNNLTGIALTHLYPRVVSASDIWDQLAAPPHRHTGRYRRFWGADLIERSSEQDVASLLDGLVDGGDHLRSVIESLWLEELPVKLLARGLEAWGDELSVKRLFSWLRVAAFPEWLSRSPMDSKRIRSWLEQRPDVQKALVKAYVDSHRQSLDPLVEQVLHGARLPSDFGRWCLDQATAAGHRPTVSYYLRYACQALVLASTTVACPWRHWSSAPAGISSCRTV